MGKSKVKKSMFEGRLERTGKMSGENSEIPWLSLIKNIFASNLYRSLYALSLSCMHDFLVVSHMSCGDRLSRF